MAINIFNTQYLEKAINVTWKRNEAISDNIANIDTPGYKRKDVNFEDYLKASTNKDTISGIMSNSRHMAIGNSSNNTNDNSSNNNIKVSTDNSNSTMRMDGNNVDIDVEMAELAKNQILFSTYTTLINKDFGMLRSAIREGR